MYSPRKNIRKSVSTGKRNILIKLQSREPLAGEEEGVAGWLASKEFPRVLEITALILRCLKVAEPGLRYAYSVQVTTSVYVCPGYV